MRATFKRYCLLLAFLMASAVTWSGQSGMEWPGWRGLSKQGLSEKSGPVTWSADTNVAWKTSLPGQGHSSPIIVDDNIIVTAANSAAHGQKIRLTGMYILLALTMLLLLSSGPYFFRYCRTELSHNKEQFRSMLMFCLLVGLFLHVLTLLTQRSVQTDHRSYYVVWLQSFLLAGVGIALVITNLTNRSRYRITLGILAMVLVVPLILLRPKPEYYDLGRNDCHLCATYLSIMLLISVGLASLIGTFLRRRKSENGSNQQANADNPMRFPLSLAVFFLTFVCGFFGLGITYWIPMMVRSGWLSVPDSLSIWMHWEALMAVGCVLCIAPWCLMQIFSKALPPVRPHRFFAPGMLSMVLLCMIMANYVGRKDSYVRAIICIDRATGTIKWQCDGLAGPKVVTHKWNSPASPTPIIHRGKVYAYFGTPGLMCTDMQGNLLWSDNNLPFEGVHGVGSSLVADENCVIVTSLNSKDPYITALNAETGTPLWTAKLPKWSGIHGEHRTPLIANLNNTKVLLNWSKIHNELTALKLDSGRELWSFQPEGKFAGRQAVAGIIQKENILYLPSRVDFAAIDISALATGGAPREIWRTNLHNKGPITSSPLLHKGLIFMVSDRGYASCLNADSGELLWREKLPRSNYPASPIIMGQNVYFCNTSGLTTIIACESTFKQVAQNKLPNAIYATPAPVDGHLYIRTTARLWCIQ